MKKIITGIVLLILLLAASVYIFIPGKLSISSAASYTANREGVYRFLINDSNWQKWWPGAISKKNKGSFIFRYKDYDFQIEKVLYDVIQLKLEAHNDSSRSLLKVIPYNNDSIGVEFSTELNTGSNPFSRISGYFRAKKIKQALDTIVLSLEKHTSELKNIYGFNIKKEKVQYQHLISAKESFSHYPTTEDVYAIIGRLRSYIAKYGAGELFSPMLNIKRTDSTTYIAQVGIPVNRELPKEGDIASKWMMKGGDILSAEVTGGTNQIAEATKQIEKYMSDYQRSIIAIPFQMLITDRTKEPDSTKWITRIYYPVM